MIRVLVVEDHPATANGLAGLVAAEADLDVAGVALTYADAERELANGPPDVVLCDIMLDGVDTGLDLLERHCETAPFVIISGYTFQAHHARAVRAGARAFLSKTCEPDDMIRAIRSAAAGRSEISIEVLQSAKTAPKRPSRREQQLLELVIEGAANDVIAERLALQVKTVEGMLHRLFDRYAMENRTQLARLAMRQGWLTSVDLLDGDAGCRRLLGRLSTKSLRRKPVKETAGLPADTSSLLRSGDRGPPPGSGGSNVRSDREVHWNRFRRWRGTHAALHLSAACDLRPSHSTRPSRSKRPSPLARSTRPNTHRHVVHRRVMAVPPAGRMTHRVAWRCAFSGS